jgi:hypothetical protein
MEPNQEKNGSQKISLNCFFKDIFAVASAESQSQRTPNQRCLNHRWCRIRGVSDANDPCSFPNFSSNLKPKLKNLEYTVYPWCIWIDSFKKTEPKNVIQQSCRFSIHIIIIIIIISSTNFWIISDYGIGGKAGSSTVHVVYMYMLWSM